jgi:hypothetical protein
LLNESRSSDGHVDRERIDRARQEAENLFKPRQQSPHANKPVAAADPGSTADLQPRRQPRIFRIPPVVPMSAAQAEASPRPERTRRPQAVRPKTHSIPASQFGRVRALASYGLTQAQVAEHYGVGIEEIERIIGRGDTDGPGTG